MATTVTNGTLVVTIKEELTLNGKEQGGTIIKSISSCDEVFKRIITLAADTSHDVASFVSSPGTACEFDTDTLEYIRVTNLDDTTSLIVTYGGSTSAALTVPAGCSSILFKKGIKGATSDAALTADNDIASLYLRSTAAIDVELMIVNT
tara:strand:- start:527 stop:973 length:447 start_codon:yes stop_codon:yes gene_type:complete